MLTKVDFSRRWPSRWSVSWRSSTLVMPSTGLTTCLGLGHYHGKDDLFKIGAEPVHFLYNFCPFDNANTVLDKKIEKPGIEPRATDARHRQINWAMVPPKEINVLTSQCSESQLFPIWQDVWIKIAQFSEKIAIIVILKSYIFRIAQKSPNVWATFQRKNVTKTLRNSPIWSHCGYFGPVVKEIRCYLHCSLISQFPYNPFY